MNFDELDKRSSDEIKTGFSMQQSKPQTNFPERLLWQMEPKVMD